MSCRADGTNLPADTRTVVSNAEQMKVLRTEAEHAYRVYIDAFAERKTDEEIEKLWKVYVVIDRTNLAKIFELARQKPASEPAFETFAWIVTNQLTQGGALNSDDLQTMEFLRDYHATNPGIAKICWTLGRNWDPTCEPAMDFLQIAASKNPSREVRGQATLALARLKKNYSEDLIEWENLSRTVPGHTNNSILAHLEIAKAENSGELSREAEKLYSIVLSQYADCPTLLGTNQPQVPLTLGEAAKTQLYELNHLTVGKVAPGIKGEDLDGKKFKLSDYRGKVVVLNFWASWCGPCMGMVPCEVRLAERMKGKPFALVGVNGDSIRDNAKRAVEKEKITWRSFWSKEGPEGPIPTTWNIPGWPTVFILDPNGVIRFRFSGYGPITESLLNQQVDQVLEQFNKS
jgi:thiol-disulfide isomerase/thioredoxin